MATLRGLAVATMRGLAMATSSRFCFFLLLVLVFAVSAHPGRDISTETSMMEGTRIRASQRPTETELVALQERLGYKFKNIGLLMDALTHSSYSGDNNDALHVLGAKSVEQAIALHMVLQNPGVTKSELNNFVKKHSNTIDCAKDAIELGLDSLIMVSKGVKISSKILSAAFNAVFGAITIDNGPTTANFAYWMVKRWNDQPWVPSEDLVA